MKSYRVSGKQEVLGNAPGTTFDADITEVQEARLFAGGALELAGEPATPAPKGKGSTPAPDAPEE